MRLQEVGIKPSIVKELLGEPERINGGSFTTWYYSYSASVIFYEGKLGRWPEPL